MGMQIPYMKAATNTLDSVVVQRPSCKQNLCLDKGYDFSEIEREVIKKETLHISVTEEKVKRKRQDIIIQQGDGLL